MTDTDVKLPEIEHIKARKDGLEVLADIYRYAEQGFDAIEPDDLALFRWYGIYTQRAEESAASGDPGPSDETDGLFMLRFSVVAFYALQRRGFYRGGRLHYDRVHIPCR